MADEETTSVLVAGRRRVIVLVTGVALLSLALGMLLANRIMSPEEAALRTAAPEAGHVTAPVERRVVESQVLTRGDFVYEGAMDVSIETGSLAANPVVTGSVPLVGDPVEAGTILLLVAGRPVIVLPGAVPPYRDLRPGLVGQDVLQLKQALAAVGLDPGDIASDQYDQSTSTAVAELYSRVGFSPPVPDESTIEALDGAREEVQQAEDEVAQAEHELATAGSPVPESERLQAESEVVLAQGELDEARLADPPDRAAVSAAEYQLAIATAQRDELLAPKDTSFEQGAVDRARNRLGQAQTRLTDLQSTSGTALPAAEVVFLPDLPRRIDSVTAVSGRQIDGPVLRVSGADLVVVATMSSTDAETLDAGLTAELQLGETSITGTVTQVRPAQTATGTGGQQPQGESDQGATAARRWEAVIAPAPLTPEQVEAARGQNVRVTIPVQASEGEVLAVPVAALSAAPNGDSRVTVQHQDGSTSRVVVDVGLTAGGFAEIRPRDGELSEGDRVVVGR